MKFKEWFLAKEAVEIKTVDPEDDWELADQVDAIATISNIYLPRDKKLTLVAINEKGDVVGGAYTKWEYDSEASKEAGEPIHSWDFDVVVHPRARGTDLVGIKLIRAAEQERANLEKRFGKAYTKLWVINPHLARLLQHPKFNYELAADHKDGSAHLLKQ